MDGSNDENNPSANKQTDLLVTIKQLENKVQLYEQILDTLPWPLSVTDMNMNWTFINKPVEDMLKVKRKDMLGKHCSNWGANICKTKNCGVECLRADKPRTFFEQQNMNFQVDIAYIKDLNGDRIGHIEIVQDVTAKSKMDEYSAGFVNDVKQNLKRLAKGDIDITPKLPADNQYVTDSVRSSYAEVNADVCAVRDAVNALVSDANMLSSAAVEGKLSTRADASKHQGDYRKVVQGVNDTLDAVIGPLKVSSAYVEKISKGEIPAKIVKEYKGDFNTLKNDLNACIDGLGGLVEAGEVLKRMAVNDYTKSVDGKYSGIFADVARSINEVKIRIAHITKTVQKISKGDLGDLPEYRQIGHRSEEDELVPSLIVLMGSLDALVTDANMVANAVLDGHMHIRADAGKHDGKFRDVIEGVNGTIEAVDVPLKETMRIADAYAGGDLTARVEIETKGDFIKFGQALDKDRGEPYRSATAGE